MYSDPLQYWSGYQQLTGDLYIICKADLFLYALQKNGSPCTKSKALFTVLDTGTVFRSVTIHLTIVLLCSSRAVNDSSDRSPPPRTSWTTIVIEPIFGAVIQEMPRS